jgi:hypothetical protein
MHKEIEIFFNSIINDINECDYATISKGVMAIKDNKKNKVAPQKINDQIAKITNIKLQEFLYNKPHEDIAELSKLFQKVVSQYNTKQQKANNTPCIEGNTNINSPKIINDMNQHIFIEQFTDENGNKVCLYGIAFNNKTKMIHIVHCNDDIKKECNVKVINVSVIDYIINDLKNETTLTFNMLNTPLYKYLYNTDIITTNNDMLMKQGFNMKTLIDDIVAHFKTEMYAQYTIQVHDMLPYDDEYKTIIKKINELLLSS